MELKCFLGNFTATCWLSTFGSAATNNLLSNIDTSYRIDMLRPGGIVLSRRFACFVFAAIDAGWSRSQEESQPWSLFGRQDVNFIGFLAADDISFFLIGGRG